MQKKKSKISFYFVHQCFIPFQMQFSRIALHLSRKRVSSSPHYHRSTVNHLQFHRFALLWMLSSTVPPERCEHVQVGFDFGELEKITRTVIMWINKLENHKTNCWYTTHSFCSIVRLFDTLHYLSIMVKFWIKIWRMDKTILLGFFFYVDFLKTSLNEISLLLVFGLQKQ